MSGLFFSQPLAQPVSLLGSADSLATTNSHGKSPAEALGESLIRPLINRVLGMFSSTLRIPPRQISASTNSQDDSSIPCALSLLGVASSPKNPLGYVGAIASCFSTTSAAAAVYETNLMTNGNAVTTPFVENGWTEVLGNWGQETSCEIGGSPAFIATTQPSSTSAELYQVIDVSDYATEISERRQRFVFQGTIEALRTSNDYLPTGRFIVEYRNSMGDVLSVYDSGTSTDFSASGSFCSNAFTKTFSDTHVAPNGTTTIRVRLIADKGNAVNNPEALYAWFGSISLVAETPPPDPIPLPSLYNRNLVIDGDAGKAPFSDFHWVEVRGNWEQLTGNCVIAGSYSLAATDQPSIDPPELYQDIDVSDYTTEIEERKQRFVFEGIIKAFRTLSDYLPSGRFIVEYRNPMGDVLNTYDSGIFRDFSSGSSSSCSGASSKTFSDTCVAPSGTTTIRIRLIVDKGNAVNDPDALNAWFDSISLVAEPPVSDPIPLPSPYNRNLVINGDAGKAPFSDFHWVEVRGNWEQLTGYCVIAGSYSLGATDQPSIDLPELYQDIDVSAYATEIEERKQRFTFEGIIKAFRTSNDYLPTGRFIVEYRNSMGDVLSTYDSGIFQDFSYGSGSFCSGASSKTFSDTRAAPSGTTKIRIRLTVDKGNAVNDPDALNAWFDSISLVAEPPVSDPIPLPSPYNTNLVTNSDSPKRPLSDFNWTTQNGEWDLSGTFFEAYKQLGVQPAELSQEIDLSFYEKRISNQTQAFDFSVWIRGASSGAKGRAVLEFLDSNGFPLNSYDTGESLSSSRVQYTHSQTAPPGTKAARVRLISYKETATSPKNVFFDSMTLVAQAPLISPIPAPPVELPPGPPIGIVGGHINESGYLIFDLEDETTFNAGKVIGPRGFNGSDGLQGPEGERGPIGPEGNNDGITYATLSPNKTQITLHYNNGTEIVLELPSNQTNTSSIQGENNTANILSGAALITALIGIIGGCILYKKRKSTERDNQPPSQEIDNNLPSHGIELDSSRKDEGELI